MDLKNKTIVVVPTRFASTRLPAKFKADIAGEPMLAHVLKRVIESGYQNIFLACDHEECANIAHNMGVRVVMTDKKHNNGTDRIYEAVETLEKSGEKFSYIVNVQGDMPFFDPSIIDNVLQLLAEDGDMATMAVSVKNTDDFANPNVVKVILDNNKNALYFSRSPIPYGAQQYYKHIGIYAFTKKSLKTYVSYTASNLELTESLEQLRALENGMKIRVYVTDKTPISIDIIEDLEKARIYAQNTQFKTV